MLINEAIKSVVLKMGASKIEHPIFYNFPVGIRFEIGTGETFDSERNVLPEYISQAINRACQIFDEVFPTKPDIFALELFAETEKMVNELVNGFLDKNYEFELESISQNDSENWDCFVTISEFVHEFQNKISEVAPHEFSVNKPVDEDSMWELILYWDLSRCCIDFSNLFKEIILADFGSKLITLTSSTYLFKLDQPVMFHLYDDRGLDIISADCDRLFPIYQKFNEWILDYDREKIDAVFHSCKIE